MRTNEPANPKTLGDLRWVSVALSAKLAWPLLLCPGEEKSVWHEDSLERPNQHLPQVAAEDRAMKLPELRSLPSCMSCRYLQLTTTIDKDHPYCVNYSECRRRSSCLDRLLFPHLNQYESEEIVMDTPAISVHSIGCEYWSAK